MSSSGSTTGLIHQPKSIFNLFTKLGCVVKPHVLEDSAEESKLISTANVIFLALVNKIIRHLEKVLQSITLAKVAQTLYHTILFWEVFPSYVSMLEQDSYFTW